LGQHGVQDTKIGRRPTKPRQPTTDLATRAFYYGRLCQAAWVGSPENRVSPRSAHPKKSSWP